MKLNQGLSCLTKLSDLDEELISGGAFVSGSVTGENVSLFQRVRTSSFTTVDGVVTKEAEDSKSFRFGPARGSFRISLSSFLD
jgi:hypothetical protein